MLIEAMNENFAPAPVIEMLLIGSQFPELRARIDEVCGQYVQDFEKNNKAYARQDGYNLRLEAIRLALIRLRAGGAGQRRHAGGRGVRPEDRSL